MQVGGVALLGGDPTVNMTAREPAPLPMEGGAIAIPQAPAGAGRENVSKSLLHIIIPISNYMQQIGALQHNRL